MNYMTVSEVADRWRVSKMTVYRLIHTGQLASVRIGNTYRIKKETVTEFEEEQ